MKIINNATNTFMSVVDNILDQIANPIYYWLIIIIYIIYLAVFFGIFYVNNSYIHQLDVFIQIFIATILIIRYNPFRKHIFHENDNTIIFASAFFLLMNVGLTEGFSAYIQRLWKDDISADIHSIISL